MSKVTNKGGKADKAEVKAKRQAKRQAKKQAGASATDKPVKSKKTLVSSSLSGVGLTIAEMSDLQFTGHLGRILDRMKAKGVSMDNMKAASLRIKARRQEVLTV